MMQAIAATALSPQSLSEEKALPAWFFVRTEEQERRIAELRLEAAAINEKAALNRTNG